MDSQNYEKAIKNAKWFAVGLAVLVIIVFIFNLSAGNMNTTTKLSGILQIALMFGTIIGCHKKMLYGPICGVIVSILLILSFDIISLIFGILYLIDCIKLIKYMKN